jgi:hypothetical protein
MFCLRVIPPIHAFINVKSFSVGPQFCTYVIFAKCHKILKVKHPKKHVIFLSIFKVHLSCFLNHFFALICFKNFSNKLELNLLAPSIADDVDERFVLIIVVAVVLNSDFCAVPKFTGHVIWRRFVPMVGKPSREPTAWSAAEAAAVVVVAHTGVGRSIWSLINWLIDE